MSTRNVTAVFRTATEAQITAGLGWYDDAHNVAVALANEYSKPLPKVCGIIAALSPRQGWGSNVNMATRLLHNRGLDGGGLRVLIDKANRIYAGEPIEETLRGLKIVNFYRSILTQGREGITIDRHAYAVVTNTRYTDATMPSIGKKRYAEAVRDFERAAVILSKEFGQPFTAAQVQAITWVTWRQRYWAPGAFDHFAAQPQLFDDNTFATE